VNPLCCKNFVIVLLTVRDLHTVSRASGKTRIPVALITKHKGADAPEDSRFLRRRFAWRRNDKGLEGDRSPEIELCEPSCWAFLNGWAVRLPPCADVLGMTASSLSIEGRGLHLVAREGVEPPRPKPFFSQQLSSSRWPLYCDHSVTSADVRVSVGSRMKTRRMSSPMRVSTASRWRLLFYRESPWLKNSLFDPKRQNWEKENV
jgi:hypothetical protein